MALYPATTSFLHDEQTHQPMGQITQAGADH
jgi:hypothetical protein